jgi:hypothetical protein
MIFDVNYLINKEINKVVYIWLYIRSKQHILSEYLLFELFISFIFGSYYEIL